MPKMKAGAVPSGPGLRAASSSSRGGEVVMATMSERTDYTRGALERAELALDPVGQFLAWFADAERAGLHEPNAMTLATATPDGLPSARIVLLRQADERGFSFFTNYSSRKAAELEANPHAALVFFWPSLERQVRVEGRVERVAEAESDAYFAGRPEASKLGAWASPQSAVLTDREGLEARLAEVRDRFGAGPISRPPFWGGFRVVPAAVEFWQGRSSRLHDRFRYRRHGEASWILERLAP